jgi:hypothetical protein
MAASSRNKGEDAHTDTEFRSLDQALEEALVDLSRVKEELEESASMKEETKDKLAEVQEALANIKG